MTNFIQYFAVDTIGDLQWLTTFTSSDGVERIIAQSVAYVSVHGPSAAIGSQWEFAVNGEDEYSPSIAQTWVDSLESQGEVFLPENYKEIHLR